MNYRVAASQSLLHCGCIANVASDEGVARILRNRFQIGKIAGIGQLVVVDDRITLLQSKDMTEKVRADESGADCDEDLHRVTSCRAATAPRPPCANLFAPVLA